jgi:endonuclease/exonuclease/phosphatase family metal-dependent hydrolase
MGLQECLDFQAEYIAEKLPEFEWVGRGRNAEGDGEMTAVFFRKDRLVPEQTAHFWLSDTPEVPGSQAWDAALPRIATVVRFVDKSTQRPFLYFNTHFDHKGVKARVESAKLLAARVEEAPAGLPIVVTGDFNAQGESSEPWNTLTAGVLADAWVLAADRKGPANTSNGFATPAPDAARRIDWILVREGVRVKTCATLDHQIDGRYPSDHFPVLATVILR